MLVINILPKACIIYPQALSPPNSYTLCIKLSYYEPMFFLSKTPVIISLFNIRSYVSYLNYLNVSGGKDSLLVI